MKTLEEVMTGMPHLPWISGGTRTRIYNVASFDGHCGRDFAIRAANSFPKLVKFVEAQKCECGGRSDGVIGYVHKCHRCALLEEVLR